MSDGKIKIKFLGDDKELNKTFKGIQDTAVKAFGGLGKIAMAGVSLASTAVSGMFAIGQKYNMEMESYTTNFKVLLGGAEQAVAKVSELKTMAAKTPFGMGDLAESTQTLLAFQVPAKKTSEILSMLGDVALGDKEKLKGLSLVFGQVSSAGKLSGQDLMQFINQGFNPLNYIAKETGESMEELRDRMSKGKITVEEVEKALKAATSSGGQFYKGMEEASKTTSGLISTLQDNANALIGEVFQPISASIISDVLPNLLSGMDKMTEAFKKDGVQGLIKASGEFVSEMITKVAEEAPKLITAGTELLKGLLEGINANSETIGKAVADIMLTLITAVIELAPMLLECGANIILSLMQGLADNSGNIVETIKTLIQTLIDLFKNPEKMIEFIKCAVEIINALVTGLMEALPSILVAIPQIISSMITVFISLLAGFIDVGSNILKNLWNGVVNALVFVLGAIGGLMLKIKDGFMAEVNKFVDIGKNIIDGIWKGISDGWNWLTTKVGELASGLFNAAKKALDINSPSRKFEWIADMSMEGLDKGFTAKKTKVLNTVKGITGSILSNANVGMLRVGNDSGNTNTNQNDYSKTITQNFYSNGLTSPFEAYRKAMLYGY